MGSPRAILLVLLYGIQVGITLGARRIKQRGNRTEKKTEGAARDGALHGVSSFAVGGVGTADAVARVDHVRTAAGRPGRLAWVNHGSTTMRAAYAEAINSSSMLDARARPRTAKRVRGKRRANASDDGLGIALSDLEQIHAQKESFPRPEVREVLRTLPVKAHKPSECFQLGREKRLGCRDKCTCKWFERCYPKYVLYPGEERVPDGVRGPHTSNSTLTSLVDDSELLSIDVGTCAWSMQIMVFISIAAFLITTIAVVILRMCLLLVGDLREHFNNQTRSISATAQHGPSRVKISSSFNVP